MSLEVTITATSDRMTTIRTVISSGSLVPGIFPPDSDAW